MLANIGPKLVESNFVESGDLGNFEPILEKQGLHTQNSRRRRSGTIRDKRARILVTNVARASKLRKFTRRPTLNVDIVVLLFAQQGHEADERATKKLRASRQTSQSLGLEQLIHYSTTAVRPSSSFRHQGVQDC